MKNLKLPNLGENIQDATVLNIYLKEGKSFAKDEIILELETDKATVEIPADRSGKVLKILIKVGDKVNSGQEIVKIQEKEDSKESIKKEPIAANPKEETKEIIASSKELVLNNLGEGITEVGVLKVAVKEGQEIKQGDILLEIETDKATVEIPSQESGVVEKIFSKEGEKVKVGAKILTLSQTETPESKPIEIPESKPTETPESKPIEVVPSQKLASNEKISSPPENKINKILVAASPIVRRFARELGVDLQNVTGSLARGRISIEDVKKYVKNQSLSATGATSQAPLPDFSRWGKISHKNLSNIKKTTARNMARIWQTIPHVTNFHEVDITSLEEHFKKYQKIAAKNGLKLTITTILTKICSLALKKFPNFNASYDPHSEELICKDFISIALAVDTKDGLVVPVIRDVDKKDIYQIAKESAIISQKARDKKLSIEEMMGQSFTISSLGGVGKVKGFTPIINHPDVAILGISRSFFQNEALNRKIILPLSLSYDHRVIDGAEATRFMSYLASILEEPFFPFM